MKNDESQIDKKRNISIVIFSSIVISNIKIF